MTTAEPIPMTTTPDPQPDSDTAASATPEAKTRRWARLGDNSLLVAFIAGGVALFIFFLGKFDDVDDKIDNVEVRLTDKIDDVEVRLTDKIEDEIEALDTKLTGKIDALDTKVDETNLKLTALIAGLDKTEEVDAAVEGRLPEPEPAGAPG